MDATFETPWQGRERGGGRRGGGRGRDGEWAGEAGGRRGGWSEGEAGGGRGRPGGGPGGWPGGGPGGGPGGWPGGGPGGRRGGGRGRGGRGGGPWGFPGFGPFGGPPPWAGHRSRAQRGDVRAAILALLSEEPRNGYQIIQELKERSEGEWRPSPGAVYPALQQLADEGLIEGEEQDGRRMFRLSEAGRAYVEEHAEEVDAPWEAMTTDVRDDVRDLFTTSARTGAAVMQIVQTGTESQVAEAKEILSETRRKLYHLLAEDE